jgi:hypothetical protein
LNGRIANANSRAEKKYQLQAIYYLLDQKKWLIVESSRRAKLAMEISFKIQPFSSQ